MAKSENDINDLAAEQGGLADLANKLSNMTGRRAVVEDGQLKEVRNTGPIQSGSGVGKSGSPLFAGKMTGGGGFSTTDFGGDFTRAMIASGVSPSIYGLEGTASDYAPGGKFSVGGKSSLSPGGYQSTAETGEHGGETAVFLTAERLDPIDVKFDKLISDPSMSGMGLTPDMSTFVNPGDQPQGSFLGNVGKSVTSVLGRLAKIHPATRNATFALGFIKGLQDAKDPKSFVTNVVKQLGASKIGSNLGLSGIQKQGVGSLINMAQGKQDLGQTIKGLGTSAAFRKAAPSIFKSAYDKGGMNGVYAAAAALSMAQKAAMRKAMQPGPGGGG